MQGTTSKGFPYFIETVPAELLDGSVANLHIISVVVDPSCPDTKDFLTQEEAIAWAEGIEE